MSKQFSFAALAGASCITLAALATPPAAAPLPATPQATGVIKSILVKGSQRLEPETIRAYAQLAPGQTYTRETLDTALKTLYSTQLFADVTITGGDTGNIVIAVREILRNFFRAGLGLRRGIK